MTPWCVPCPDVLLMAKPHAMRAYAVRHYQRVVTHSVGPRRAAPNGSNSEPKKASGEAEKPGITRTPGTVNLLYDYELQCSRIQIFCSDQ